jgi:hypothetical protein
MFARVRTRASSVGRSSTTEPPMVRAIHASVALMAARAATLLQEIKVRYPERACATEWCIHRYCVPAHDERPGWLQEK